MERLQKLMAQANIGSRRECEKIIEQGRVRVNGRIAKLGNKADPITDKIEVDGRTLTISRETLVYVALNKPKGVISSLEDELQQNRKTVRDLIPLPGHLYPVGRLDKQSEGLMLMTNDGDIAHKLTHPRFGHEKTYHVVVEGFLSDQSIEKWQRGGMPLDGKYTAPAKIVIIRQERKFTQLKVTLREGRKRQIRRIANMLGHSVRELVRESIGPIKLGKLKSGQWRHLHPEEIEELRRSVLHQSVKEKPAQKRRRSGKSRRPRSQHRPSGKNYRRGAEKQKKKKKK
ncbi:MAG: rRNA pseudouridine synthase [Chloroflexi bacterium]|nr:MAG: rRNA pseudouridine synthase [Chloroflexota bacterium]